MTDPFHIRECREAIESLHGGSATFRATVRVVDTFGGQVAIEVDVHLFDLEGHATATLAYAWSQPVDGSTKRRILAVLHQHPVVNALAAVRAGVAARFKADKEAEEGMEQDLEALRQTAADARQRGDIERAEKIEKAIAWIERGGERGRGRP